MEEHRVILAVVGGVLLVMTAVACNRSVEAPAGDGAAMLTDVFEQIKDAPTMHYVSVYQRWFKGKQISDSTYEVWLAKPDRVRIEAATADGERRGVLVGDGGVFRVYWPTGRPSFAVAGLEADESPLTTYFEHITPAYRFSIAHQMSDLGVDIGLTTFEQSCFHGYTETMAQHLDGVQLTREELVDSQPCRVLEASYMEGQRVQRWWIARSDGLPRKVEQVVHASPSDVVSVEQWAEVELGPEMSDSLFDWQPPDDWARVDKVPLDEVLLQPGTPAPDFELAGVDGGTVRLSELRGQVVWLTFWKLGCPPCRLEMVALEALHRECGERGLAVVGFNCMDELERARAYLADAGVTFRNVVDTSDLAWHVYVNEYTVDQRVGGVPLNFIIDRDGTIVKSWSGYYPDDHRGEETVRRLLDAA